MDIREAQLFVDDDVIESFVRVHRTIHQPRKFGPVLQPDRPWEGNELLSPTVLKHPETGRFQMWYMFRDKRAEAEQGFGEQNICYALSEDGANWDKPVVGEVECRGSTQNNIVVGRGPLRWVDLSGVVFDPEGPNEERRYKMLIYSLAENGKYGYFAAFSADGVHWKMTEDYVDPREGDTTTLMCDPAEKRYVNYTRRHGMMDEHRRRVIYRSESSDFEHWTEPELALAPDLADSHDVQFYRYESLYLGFLHCMHTKEDRIDVQLVTSRDNQRWQRTELREVFLPNGPKGSWDGGGMWMASSPPIVDPSGQRLWLYYMGSNAWHSQRWPFQRSVVGLATLRRDGFASIDAGPVEGILTTRAFVWPDGKLLVNVNAGAAAGIREWNQEAGYARLEVLDDKGAVIPGLSRDESKPFGYPLGDVSETSGSLMGHEFQWTSGKDLSRLVGENIKLRFYLVNAELYSFRAIS